jgi:hypothetical protein
MVRAAAYLALAEMRAITHAEGKPSSYPNMRAGVMARAMRTSARAPTMAHAQLDRRHRLGAAMKHR